MFGVEGGTALKFLAEKSFLTDKCITKATTSIEEAEASSIGSSKED